MDPDDCLARMRRALINATTELGAGRLEALDEVAMYADALDSWMTRGGFPPSDWVPRG